MKLIRDVGRNPYHAGISRKLQGMARVLGVTTIAEGIETEGVWEWVRKRCAD